MLGQRIGSYRVLRKLGEGGMGAVFEAVHEQIGKRAAIKVLHSEFSRDPQMAMRFFNEARAVNVVDHPGIVQIYEFGHLPDGAGYLVMEFLNGQPLSARLKATPPPGEIEILRLFRQIASALTAAHEKGIVHRDLKPDNVMIVPDHDGERAKVLDFGIARLGQGQGQPDPGLKTSTGVVMGTPSYMAPEQCRGAGGVTDRSDVYSLGVMLFQALTGALPFVGEGHGAVIAMHIYEKPRPVRALNPAASAESEMLVQLMMAKDPAQRPRMADVARELGRLSGSVSLPGPRSQPTAAPAGTLIAPPTPAGGATAPPAGGDSAWWLSVVLPGLGQLCTGRANAGIAWFFGTLFGYCLLLVPGLVLHALCILDASPTRPHARRTIAFACSPALLFLGLIILAKVTDNPAQRAREEAEHARHTAAQRAKLVEGARLLQERLARVKRNFPVEGSLEERACPDAKIEEGLTGTRPSSVPYVNIDTIDRSDKAKGQPDPQNEWSWLGNLNLSVLVLPANDAGATDLEERVAAQERLKATRYLGVLSTSHANLPAVKDSRSFIGGHFDGSIVLFNLLSGKPLCSAQLNVENRAKLKHRKRSDDIGDILLDDFKSQFKDAVKDSLGRISKSVTIEL